MEFQHIHIVVEPEPILYPFCNAVRHMVQAIGNLAFPIGINCCKNRDLMDMCCPNIVSVELGIASPHGQGMPADPRAAFSHSTSIGSLECFAAHRSFASLHAT